jgi:hypothetical protein
LLRANARLPLIALVMTATISVSTDMAKAESWSIGILGGISPTSGFPNEVIVLPTAPPQFIQYSSTGNGFLVGVAGEVRLPKAFAVEVDGIYHPLNFKAATSSVLPTSSLRNTVLSWTFPILVKRRFDFKPLSSRGMTPLLELGPTFRASGNRNDTALSSLGVTLGGALDVRAGRARLTPTIRYTRWAADQMPTPYIPSSRRNQIELLVGFSF